MSTPNYLLSDLVANQLYPETIINENNAIIDALLTPNILDRITAPPGSPSNGDMYIPLATATGAWAGYEDDIAYYLNGWIFITPLTGQVFYDLTAKKHIFWSGSAWIDVELKFYETITLKSAAYTVTEADNNSVIYYNTASSYTVTLPQTTTATLNVGYNVDIVNLGTGTITVAIEGSDNLYSISSLVTVPQYGRARITKLIAGAPNTWSLSGDLA